MMRLIRLALGSVAIAALTLSGCARVVPTGETMTCNGVAYNLGWGGENEDIAKIQVGEHNWLVCRGRAVFWNCCEAIESYEQSRIDAAQAKDDDKDHRGGHTPPPAP